MNLRVMAVAAVLSLSGLAIATARAQPPAPPADATLYVLDEQSTFEAGCFGPCKCPVAIEPLRGEFELTRTDPDPLFDNYTVTNVQWEVPGRDPALKITGSGTYRVGGEFALQQQLSLDLTVGDGPVQHFDSGLVLGGGTVKLDVTISLHGMMACFDTVMRVVATPVVAEVPPGEASLLRDARPNPFHARTEIEFSLPAAGSVDLAVYDASGRVVRALAQGARFAAGPHVLSWDGRRADGSECAPGLYFVRIRAGGREALLRITRLK